ncbi:MAG: GAF domain-containing protein [Chloroflexi bacterium]|nr:MAG: GAF domain-containing protein [Chloroflexota bacterium]MBL1194419.1 GAF domain-containing sensor histidine kinase [Chloroflexota bacterium]NOH11707.1 GAF domain-containing sensor histidine kinase [Chloroflexota bacterium]
MSTRFLKWLAFLLPVAFFALVLLLRFGLSSFQPSLLADVVALIILAVGTLVFSIWVFNIIEQREAEIRQRSMQLEALHEAGLALTTELKLRNLLQKIVDISCELVNAKYGALGVLRDDGSGIEQFITAGLTEEEYNKIGDLPKGRGLLGHIINQRESVIVPSIEAHEDSVGFPEHHPPMHSLLGVPIISKGELIGDIYMTDKIVDGEESAPFTPQDQQILEMFATQAAIAIENAKLYRQTEQLAILQERERFSMDLHDGLIQSIYATGLSLESTQKLVEAEVPEASTVIQHAIQSLNDTIRDVRNYILGLRPQRFQGRDLLDGLDELKRDLRANSFLEINTHPILDDFSELHPESTVELLHIAQEVLSNVRKHARATRVDFKLEQVGDEITLSIEDNGIGFSKPTLELENKLNGHGLHNIQERAKALQGEVRIDSTLGQGTLIAVCLPYPG